MDEIKREIDEFMVKSIQTTCLSIYGEIVKNTPVDTGRAAGNWNADLNRANFFTQEPSAGLVAIQDGIAQNKVKAMKVSDTYTISNGLPYIQVLNDSQKYILFIESAIDVGMRKADQLMGVLS